MTDLDELVHDILHCKNAHRSDYIIVETGSDVRMLLRFDTEKATKSAAYQFKQDYRLEHAIRPDNEVEVWYL